MLISNVSQDRTIPYWDEIRNLSIEDKYSVSVRILGHYEFGTLKNS